MNASPGRSRIARIAPPRAHRSDRWRSHGRRRSPTAPCRQSIPAGASDRLYNEDLAPTKERNWGTYSLFAMWMSDVHSIGGYTFAAGLFFLGLAAWQVGIAMVIGIFIVYGFMLMSGRPGSRPASRSRSSLDCRSGFAGRTSPRSYARSSGSPGTASRPTSRRSRCRCSCSASGRGCPRWRSRRSSGCRSSAGSASSRCRSRRR